MTITISRESLSTALSAVTRAIERRNTIPVLSNCLIETQGAGIRVTGSDLDIQIEMDAAADCDGALATTLPAATLADIARSLPAGADIRIAPAGDGGHMAVSSGRSRFKLQVLPAGDFPKLSGEAFDTTFTVPAKAFAAAVDAVAFAISTEETRYYLNGIYMHADEAGNLVLVATDGHRLAKRELHDVEAGAMPGIIIPRKTCAIIPKLLPDGEITISVAATKIRIAAPGIILTSKLIDGTFPDYRRVIPAPGGAEAILDAKALDSALARVATVAGVKGRATRFAFAGGTLTLTVANPDAGDAEDSLAYEGEAERVTGFNATYVADSLACLGAETVSITQADAGSPALLTPVPPVEGALSVVMPMRV